MNMKKGFTLTESLIAMAIVGVIAGFIMPGMIKNVQKHESEMALSRAMQQIELGCQNMIQRAAEGNQNLASANATMNLAVKDRLSALTLGDVGLTTNEDKDKPLLPNLDKVIGYYWGVVEDNNEIDPRIKSEKNVYNTFCAKDMEASKRYTFEKVSGSIGIKKGTSIPTAATKLLEASTEIVIYVDTNGWQKAPNIFGKDLFSFLLLNSGKIVPNVNDDAGRLTEQFVKDGFKIKYY